jgi:hypothetical protein
METLSNSRILRAVLAAFAVTLAGFALAACGGDGEAEGHSEREVVGEGERVELGPLEYNVLFTRPLNRFDVEDRQYTVGQPPPEPGETYIGVFIRIRNLDEDKAHRIPESFEIVDTEGQRFENIPSESIYALDTGASLGPDDQLPAIDSPAQTGTIQAALLLYLVPDEVLELRPVELEVEGEDGKSAAFELDL